MWEGVEIYDTMCPLYTHTYSTLTSWMTRRPSRLSENFASVSRPMSLGGGNKDGGVHIAPLMIARDHARPPAPPPHSSHL